MKKQSNIWDKNSSWKNNSPEHWYLICLDFLHGFMMNYITGVEIPEKKAKKLNDANFYSNPTVHRYHDSLNSSGMLAGYAIETLLKCCLAIINLETGGEMSPNHYLKEHAKKINEEWKISLDTEEAEFLDQMEAYIRWKARYPASTSGKEKFNNRPIEVTGLYANLRKV